MDINLFLQELDLALGQRLASETLFQEISTHKNTKSLFKSPTLENVNLVTVLMEVLDGIKEEAASSSNVMFLGTVVPEFFKVRSSDEWL